MTDDTPSTPDTPGPGGGGGRAETVVRMRAIAAGLHGSGLDARVHDTRGVLHITATLYNAGGRGTDVTVDEDGYVQISYWNDPAATPAQIIEVIASAHDRCPLTAVRGPGHSRQTSPGPAWPTPPPQQRWPTAPARPARAWPRPAMAAATAGSYAWA